MTESGLELRTSKGWGHYVEAILKNPYDGLKELFGPALATHRTLNKIIKVPQSLSNLSAEDSAWELFRLSASYAFDCLAKDCSDKRADIEFAVAKFFQHVCETPDKFNTTVPANYLERPTRLPLYQHLRDYIISRKADFELEDDDQDMAERIDDDYIRAFEGIYKKNIAVFKELEDALTTNTGKAAQERRAIDAYHQKLADDFNMGYVFNGKALDANKQPIKIKDIYVRLRAIWKEPKDEQQETLRCMMLDDKLIQNIISETEGDWLQLVGGGPGSGKSTTMRALAAQLHTNDLQLSGRTLVLFLPLQHLSFDKHLRDGINDLMTDPNYTGNAPQAKIEIVSNEILTDLDNLILLCDGLDELALPEKGSTETIDDFMRKLDGFKTLCDRQNVNLKAIVTGRIPAFEQACSYMKDSLPGHCRLDVMGFVASEGFINRPDNVEDLKLFNRDYRYAWWENYSHFTKNPKAKIPKALTSDAFRSITQEPLLCFLLARTQYLGKKWQEAANNINLVYTDLLDSVYQRQWGDPDAPGHGNLSKEDFDILIPAIGLAAWRGGHTRIATKADFEDTLDLLEQRDCWDAFCAKDQKDATTLAMNFYIHTPKVESDKGFEFTHKNFGDYLAAREILHVAKKFAGLPKTGDSRSKAQPITEDTLEDWIIWTANCQLTPEILDFMRNQCRLELAQGQSHILHGLKDYFTKLIDLSLEEGLPAHSRKLQGKWRQLETYQLNAERCLWAIAHSCVYALSTGDTSVTLSISWPKETSLQHLLNRQNPEGYWNTTFNYLLLRLSATNDALFSHHLDGARLNHARLDHASLVRTSLVRTRLDEASLNNASLNNARLDGASLVNTSLNNASLIRASLDHARLDEASLVNASLDHARLANASLVNASLDRANLADANLTGASLNGASLDGASCVRARLNQAHLDQASLEGANLEGANLEGANLIRTRLKGTSLDHANLKGVVINLKAIQTSSLTAEEFAARGAIIWDDERNDITANYKPEP